MTMKNPYTVKPGGAIMHDSISYQGVRFALFIAATLLAVACEEPASPGHSAVPAANLSLPGADTVRGQGKRSEEHTSELQSLTNLVCRLLLEKKKNNTCWRAARCSTSHTHT